MDELIPLIANLGFPIVVSIYLLVRIEEKLEALTVSLKEVSKVIAALVWSRHDPGTEAKHLLYLLGSFQTSFNNR